MNKKIVFGLGILFILVSYAVYNLPSNLTQRYAVYVNATVNVDQGIAYFDVYENLTKAVEDLKEKCSASSNIEDCVNSNKEDVFAKYNFNIVDLETPEEKAFYDFVDDFMMCEQSKDKSCRCEFRKENIANNVVVDMFSKEALKESDITTESFKELFKNLNTDYYYNFFAFNDSKPMSFAPNLNHNGLIEIKPCGINPLADNSFMKSLNLKKFQGLEIPLSYVGNIYNLSESGDSETTLNFSLVKTYDGLVCFQDTKIKDVVVNFYYFIYAYTLARKSDGPLANVETGNVEEAISAAARTLNKFYTENQAYFSSLDFCTLLEEYNFENYKEIFPECESYFLDDGSSSYLNPKIIEHANFDNFKQDLLKLRKKECNLQRHYFNFDLEYNKPVFNYKTFKFEKPVFSFSVYI